MCILLSLLLFVNGLQDFTLPARGDTPSSVSSAVPSPVPLLSMKAGDTVNFAGYTWIILDPDTGYLLMQGSYGNRYFSGNSYPHFDLDDLNDARNIAN